VYVSVRTRFDCNKTSVPGRRGRGVCSGMNADHTRDQTLPKIFDCELAAAASPGGPNVCQDLVQLWTHFMIPI